jgi:hypothetical protein
MTRVHITVGYNLFDDIMFDRTDYYMSYVSAMSHKVWLVDLWGTWMYDLVDRKNVKYYAIDANTHPVYLPPWKIVKHYASKDVYIDKSKLNTIYTDSNYNVLLDKKCYFRLQYLSNYIEHINSREVRFYNRKYYNISERYQRHISHYLYRNDEIKPLKRGIYIWQRVPVIYDPYRDKWMNKVMYKLHPWDSRMLGWVGIKNRLLSSKKHWDSYRSSHNGVKYYGHVRNRARGDRYNIHRLRDYVDDLYDLDTFHAYIIIYFSRRKFLYHMYDTRSINKMIRKYGISETSLVEDLLDNQSYFLKIDTIRTMYGLSSITPKHVLETLYLYLGTVYDDTTIYRTDVIIQNTSSIEKQSSWMYMTKEWLADYDWLSVHFVTYEIMTDIYILQQYNIYSSQSRITPLVQYKYDYWFNLVVNGLHHKKVLIRLVSREYGKYHIPLIVDTDEHDLNNVVKIYSDNAYVSISALIDIEHTTRASEYVMLLYARRNIRYNQIYKVRSSIDWTVKAERNNFILNVLVNTNAHRSLHSIIDSIRSYGAVDNNVIIVETIKYCKFILDSDIVVIANTFKRAYKMIYDYNCYMNNDGDDTKSVITSVSSMVDIVNANSIYHGRRWRAKVERIKLYHHKIDIAALNKYKYNKAILYNKDSYVNASILKSLKAAKIVDSDYDGHWEDLPHSQVNPLWYSVRNINIKAKLRVLRHVIRWDNAAILKYFEEQEKWEQFIRNEDVDAEYPNEMYNLYKYHVAVKHINAVSHQYKIGFYVRTKLIEHCGTLPFDYIVRISNRLIMYKNRVNKPFTLYNGMLPIMSDVADQVMYDSVSVIIDVHSVLERAYKRKSNYTDRWPKHSDIVLKTIFSMFISVNKNVKHVDDISISNIYGQKSIPVYVFAWYITFIDYHLREQPIKKEAFTGLISLKIHSSYGRALGGKVLVSSSRK